MLLRRILFRSVLRAFPPSTARCISSSDSLSWKEGRYNSIEVDGLIGTQEASQFAQRLRAQLQAWKSEGKGAVWLTLASSQGALIAAAASAGFEFHHAEGSQCSMMIWLQERPCPVPTFATHHVGVGGVVLDSERRILLVKDRHAKTKQWKFPGGLANLGEDLGDAVVREVFEETGVRSNLRSVLAFREMHRVAFGRSDLYVLCHLDALSTDLVIDPVEIEDACWMPVRDFVSSTKHPLARFVSQLADWERDARLPQAGGVFVEETVFIPTLNASVRCYRGAAAGRIVEK